MPFSPHCNGRLNITDINEIRFDGYINNIPLPDVLQTDSIDDEAIEVEVVSDNKSSKSMKDLIDEDKNIKRAVNECKTKT